jgi:UDP-N-acetylmuramate dehydrogenase
MRIVREPSLEERTTLRAGGSALAEASLAGERDWDELARFLERESGHPFVLGEGSNILAMEGKLPLVLIRAPGGVARSVEEEGASVLVRVPAGLRLPGLLGWLVSQGLSGLEGLAGIPGSVGGAVAMNAGSFDCRMGDALRRVRLWTPRRGLFWIDGSTFSCGYRTFDPGVDERVWLVAEAELRLLRSGTEAVRARMRDCYRRKKRSQPILARTCGCVFKNPASDLSAGYLLDACGMRGASRGGMALSEQHANFLVNTGGGRASQGLELIREAQERVRAEHGLDLETEVRLVGV